MENRICQLLGIKYPVFQGAMAWVSDGKLAAAVSEAGGLGIIAGGNAEGEIIRKEIQEAKKLTDNPFGVNIMLLSPHKEEVIKVVLEEKVACVTTGAGNPGKYIEAFHDAGIKVIPVVPSVALAKKMERLGADAVIAEGNEAGGHIGKLSTMVLLPQVADAVAIPVIGAGGIADHRGVDAAFTLGAEGVQLGTYFIPAEECRAHENYKNLVLGASDIDVTVTGRFTGHPVQVLRNKLTRKLDALEKSGGSLEEFEALGRGSLYQSVILGDLEKGSFMSGQIAGLVTRKGTCRELIEALLTDSRYISYK
ncbi:enoyl-[acyl-carrier-protein] reductase FabK [Proteiniclasticum sp. SCR006]|uniref:Probable nitronate monooxygenase n=1 Tax=Proteiniclasticum aestuarii TaxID=2817862 RepID=A0A939H7E9_9CLOT|nr:enoyl-[acyl-carrier-protein] reductase FabK [Proteiniclasticum aestuarii]MBO1265682.1 enoyl-[acyl-carrier-protein] reductase FabK [Proteiniclasticum aestuarii]